MDIDLWQIEYTTMHLMEAMPRVWDEKGIILKIEGTFSLHV